MSNLLTISLNNVRFRAYHGLHPEERQKGNDFVVNMQVNYVPKSGIIGSLEDTIDYADLFAIINSTMQHPVDLLETLVQTIAHGVHQKFPHVPFFLQVGNSWLNADDGTLLQYMLNRYEWLIDEAMKSKVFKNVKVLPQLHAFVWGNKRGV